MDQQHPIPQHISSYQFRLVGDMTLKQFFQLAGGCLVSLLFYASPLHPLIKWPAILFFALLGVALAFLPFEDRPLETWIVAFFKSIYTPTMYSWKKEEIKKFFQDEGVPMAPSPEKLIVPKGEEALKEYLAQTQSQKAGFIVKLETAESSFLSKLGQLVNVAVASPQPQPGRPQFIPIPGAPPPPPLRPKMVVEEKTAPLPMVTEEVPTTPVAPTLTPQMVTFGKRAQFSIEAAPPNPPTIPNIVVGQVLDSSGKILDGVIMEIRDAAGRPVRALKSNKLGHFMIATPLANGRYEVITEKEGYEFDPVSFEAQGAIILPIEIRAKGTLATAEVQSPNNSTIQPLQQ